MPVYEPYPGAFDSIIRETVAKAIYDKMEGPVANQDFGRQCAQWELSLSLADAALSVLDVSGVTLSTQQGGR